MSNGEVREGFVPHSHIPYGEAGEGHYFNNTLGTYENVNTAVPMALEVLESIPYDGKGPFVICDYGAADGGSSMNLMRCLIEALEKKYGKDVQIQLIFEDQPSNDFKSVFLLMQGLVPGPPTFLQNRTNVSVFACGTNFFEKCLPTNSLHMGFSSSAMHWPSEKPGNFPDAFMHVHSKDEATKAVYAKQLARDWERILLARADELKKGGRMLIGALGINKDGKHNGNYSGGVDHFEQLGLLWKKMVQEGKVTQEEFEETTICQYLRTEEEFTAPFNDKNSPVMKAGLRLVSIQTTFTPCAYREAWMKSGKKANTEDARAHAKWFTPTVRTWSNSTFLSGLSALRTDEEKKGLVNELFQKYEDEVAKAPEDNHLDYVHTYIHIEKI